MKNFRNNTKGIALAISMMLVAVTTVLSTTYVSRAVFEKSMADREIRTAKSFYASEAGGNAGLEKLTDLINTSLLTTVQNTDPSVVIAQVGNSGGYVQTARSIEFLVAYTKSGNTALLTQTGSGVTAVATYTGSSTSINSTGSYIYKIVITPKGNPSTFSTNTWDFPYYYQIQTTGTDGNQTRKTTINGDFTVRVRKDNFARFALFTNAQTISSGGANVWFTNFTNFSGPMFTNGRFNYAYNPSGNFYGNAQQHDQQARFYNNGNNVSINSDHNGTIDVPTFYDGFDRNMPTISLPNSSDQTAMMNQATAGQNLNSNGIYVPTSGSTVAGGIYVKGDATVAMSVDASNRAVYTIVQGGTTKTVTVDRTNNQTIVKNVGTGATSTYTGKPEGVDHVGTLLYVNGNITNFSGTVQKDTQILVAANNDIVIQNHVQYSQYTAATGSPGATGYVAPSAEGYTNMLGIMSWTGDVRIGSSAPNNLNIHGTVMAKNGIVGVDNYDSGAVRGTITLLGGIISNYYGGFGTMGAGGSQATGYGRNIIYDTRMETQATPPYFPTLNTFIAFSNDINDKKFSQTGGF